MKNWKLANGLLVKDAALSLKTIDAPANFKSLTDEGTFEGYGSIFGNLDAYGEKVMPGSFVESLAAYRQQGLQVLMLFQHDPNRPIGVWEDMAEDAKGLYCKGRFLLSISAGREAYEMAKAGVIRGLSIGYREQEVDQQPNGTREIKKVELMEVSVVSFPANRRARIGNVKSEDEAAWEKFKKFAQAIRDNEKPSVKDFEDILRDAGVPKTMAVRIASVGYAKAIRSDSEGEAKNAAADFLKEVLSAVKPKG